jgi:lipoate-protein ligase A
MALDEALAAAERPAPTLRLYRWDPWTLSLGWFQRVGDAELAPFLRAGFGVTRRPTGGGAIFHADELTYSVVLPADDPRIPRDTAASYDWLHEAVRAALAEEGVATEGRGRGAPEAGSDPFFCFARTAAIDLVARGRKLVGSAQRRTRSAFLQHGSIPLSPNGTAPGSTSVAEERGGRAVDPARLEEALGRAFARALGAEAVPASPTPEEEARADSLEREKYGNLDWVRKPWKGRGRETPGALPGGAIADVAALPPLRVLRAEVAADHLRVTGAVGGDRPTLPHGRLRAFDVGAFRTVETRALTVERDPWDSTFRRSAFADGRGEADPEGTPPSRVRTEETDVALLLLYDGPPALLRIDGRRFNYADLGERRTGGWERDLAALVGALAVGAPGAARGPGAVALLAGALPPGIEAEGVLHHRLALLAGPGRTSRTP